MSLRETLAQELYDSLEWAKRDDGSDYVRFVEGCPLWVESAVRDAHGDMLPDDLMFELCERLAGRLAGEDPDNWDNYSSEIADSMVDVRNHDLLKWVGSHMQRAFSVDEVLEQGLNDPNKGFYHLIQCAQYEEAQRTLYTLISAIDKEAGERWDGSED